MKILITIFILLILLLIALLIYVTKVGIKSIPPKDDNRSYIIRTETFRDRNIFIMTPKSGKKSDLTILYLHGGAYALGIDKQHWDFFDDAIAELKCTIVAPDYPLTPKAKYTDVYDMVTPIYLEMIQRLPKEKFIVIGDSAGGGIALGLAEYMGEKNVKQPGKLILISPWLDVRMTNPKIDEVQKYDHMLLKENLKLVGEIYADQDGMNQYLVNPIDGPVEKLENVTILTGTYDILNPDVHVFAKRAEEKGINITIKETPKAPHIWALERHMDKIEYAQEGYEELIKTIQE